MKRKYVFPIADLISLCSDDIMNGSFENVLTYSANGLGDVYSYEQYFGN